MLFLMVPILVQVILLLKTNGEVLSNKQELASCWDLGVALTVSPLVTTSPPRQLILSWWHADPKPGDTVALLQTDPRQPSRPLLSRDVATEEGHSQTNIQASTVQWETLGFTAHCLGYWAAYMRNGSVLASSCLRTQPTWMWDLKDELQRMKLKHMFLPGTHDSAAYQRYGGAERETLVTKYSITQEENIVSQLIYGIRYLDLRVGYYKHNVVQWWANHGVKRIHPLAEILAQVKSYMQRTNEVVVLDLQEFNPGFGSGMEVHLKLVGLLARELSPFMALPSLTWEARLEDVWASGRRLIVTYDDPRVVANSTLLWPAVEHRWGNVQSLDALYNHLGGTMRLKRMPGPKPWAAMAELTPTPWTLLTDQLGGLRRMAHLVNRNVTSWFRGRWGAEVNVLAVDFFRSTGVVEEAIKWNRRRARQLTCS